MLLPTPRSFACVTLTSNLKLIGENGEQNLYPSGRFGYRSGILWSRHVLRPRLQELMSRRRRQQLSAFGDARESIPTDCGDARSSSHEMQSSDPGQTNIGAKDCPDSCGFQDDKSNKGWTSHSSLPK
jgi:hypothetical protein